MSLRYSNICAVGPGHIGLPMASLLGTKDYKVLGVDVTCAILETINKGSARFAESDVHVLLKPAVRSGNLSAGIELSSADVFIIAVPMPLRNGCHPDLSYVEAPTKTIARS